MLLNASHRWAASAAALALLGAACGSSAPMQTGDDAGFFRPIPDGPSSVGDASPGSGEAAAGDAGSGWTFAPTTSVAELTQNNTAGCGSSAAPCTEAWTPIHKVTYGAGSSYAGTTRAVDGFWDDAVSPGAQNAGSADGYVSKVPVSTLLPGYAVPIWVETQNWWGNGGGHIDNGEDSASAQQIKNQVADHISRGFAGQVVDWYGPGTTADEALPTIRSSAEASGGKYGFAVMIDKGYFGTCGNTVACLNDGLSYIAKTYGGSSAYAKDGHGRPLVFFFVNSYYPQQYALLQSNGVQASGTSFVMYEPNGFPGGAPPNTIGEYAWVNPADGAAMTQTTGSAGTFSWEADFGLKDLTGFFGAASASPGSYAVSEAHKGFDDNLANWSLNRVIDQQCGMTWLETFDHTGSFGGSASYQGSLNYLASGNHLDMVMVDTWDDYEEGTEIETGIDDCLGQLAVTLAGSTLTWTATFGQDPMNAAVSGSEATIDHYAVYVAQSGGTGLMHLADVACTGGTCGHSLDVSTLGIQGGPYVFYVQAVGKPSIVNTLSAATTATYGAP